ncbi:MAG: glutamate formimidoyltransferase [Bacteroidales bacterium]|jgi:glutamate formiminotransferase/formiminotetrahydrofolate cyclodeaminase|nr:glutamate formimidoyltransferase [Bacteroidales bacterium]
MNQIIECVPNFSEGRDMQVIKQITDEIERVENVTLLDVDAGATTNRTVVTFVGTPADVVTAAFAAFKKAAEVIDMRKHHGAHPRIGAVDVCPLIPISGITMEETVEYARELGLRVGKELGIPVYMYEYAAFSESRRNLAYCRSGEYEGLAEKIVRSEWKPDFGKAEFNAVSGASVVGARDFLVAINYNLNTTSVRRANAVAFDVREKGRQLRGENGGAVIDENGNAMMAPGTLKATKAIGWYIEEYGIAQVSMNITNINITPVHVAFDEVCRAAQERGMRITGSEIVGLIPKQCLIQAGKYYLAKQRRSVGVCEKELVKIAIKSMGLDDVRDFIPEEKVIEYVIDKKHKSRRLVDLSCETFADETSSESPAPGGGSVSAYSGVLAASLGEMVANLSAQKKGWEDRWKEFSEWAEKGQTLKTELLELVDEDTRAFNCIMDAFALPKKTEEEKKIRAQRIEESTLYAAEVPLRTMRAAFGTFEILRAMIKTGNPSSITDAGVGTLCARTAVLGAHLNVKVNLSSLKDENARTVMLAEAEEIAKQTVAAEQELLSMIKL